MHCRFVLRVVISSMNQLLVLLVAVLNPAPVIRIQACSGITGIDCRLRRKSERPRHAMCMPSVFLEKDSHSLQESVNFSRHRAKAAGLSQESPSAESRWPADRLRIGRQSSRNHSAARNGNRKRTRVRVACGGGIRSRGLGHQSIHGHSGLSVVSRDISLPGILPPVVHQPACELRVRQRHFSSGPRLLAALTPRDTCFAWSSAHERQPAHHQTVWATRPDGCPVIRAASLLTCPPERPEAGRGAHHPSPRTRLRLG